MIYGYGEDSLTLDYLRRINGTFVNEEVLLTFYRPSFGRNHGFGEPDFLILTKRGNRVTLWVGESKLPLCAQKEEKREISVSALKLENPFFKRMQGIRILIQLINGAAWGELLQGDYSLPQTEDTALEHNLVEMSGIIRQKFEQNEIETRTGLVSAKCCLLIFKHPNNTLSDNARVEISNKLRTDFPEDQRHLQEIVILDSDTHFDADSGHFLTL